MSGGKFTLNGNWELSRIWELAAERITPVCFLNTMSLSMNFRYLITFTVSKGVNQSRLQKQSRDVQYLVSATLGLDS